MNTIPYEWMASSVPTATRDALAEDTLQQYTAAYQGIKQPDLVVEAQTTIDTFITDQGPLGLTSEQMNMLVFGEAKSPMDATPQPAIPAGWQPIETAPDDFVLVHEDGAMRALVHTNGKWKNPSYPALVSLAWGDVLVGDDANHVLAPLGYRLELRDGCCENPTEWMPLPEVPNPESKS
jgi:hypothetical protein